MLELGDTVLKIDSGRLMLELGDTVLKIDSGRLMLGNVRKKQFNG